MGWGNVALGTALGAGTGFLTGGPAGAVIGGGIGGYGAYNSMQDEKEAAKNQYTPDRANFGLPGYEGMSEQYGGLLGQGPRSAPQARVSGFGQRQGHLANMLTRQAQGHGPGQQIARERAEEQVDRGLGQQLAMARSGRPGGGAMAARNAAMASGNLQGEGARAATMGGLAAQQGAIGQLGGVLQGARGQDQSLALGNARLRQETMGLDDRRQMELLRQQLMMEQAQQQGGQSYEQALSGRWGRQFDADSRQPSTWERNMGMAQGLGQAYLQSQAGGSPQAPGGNTQYFGKSDPNMGYGYNG